MGLEYSALLYGKESMSALSVMSFGARKVDQKVQLTSSFAGLFSNSLVHPLVYLAKWILLIEKHPNQCILISAEMNVYLPELQLSLKSVIIQEVLCLNSGIFYTT